MSAALSEGGSVLMKLGAYPFAKRHRWLQDEFGVSWQLIFRWHSCLSRPTLVFALDHEVRTANCSGQFGLLPGELEFALQLLRHFHPL